MPAATQAIPSFLGGELSQFAQGRFDKPDYHISLNVCLNAFPVEIGAWTRRPGTQYAGHTRAGSPGRVMEFDFEQASPYSFEFTNGWVRFRSGTSLATTNDTQTVSAISTANPAVVNTSASNTWATGNTVIFPPGVPLLENRQFTITRIDATHFSLQDAITGSNINGSALSAIPAGFTVNRVQELQTVFGAGSWAPSLMRGVQAETTMVLLSPSVFPQAMTVSSLPSVGMNAQFAIGNVIFSDGPYLDPFTNGVRVTPNALSGIVTMTLSFASYNAGQAYQNGTFVTYLGSNYVSLKDQNVGNTPSISPTFWATTSIGAAINNGAGLSSNDIGRLVRFFSEPITWTASTTYGTGDIVTYNPSGIPGQETYWQSQQNSNLGNTPGIVLSAWQLVTIQGSAIWTWGKITGLSNALSGSTGSDIGTMTAGGGLGAAFNGNLSQTASVSAGGIATGGYEPYGTTLTLDGYVGKNYTALGGEKIDHAVVYPSNDIGLGGGTYSYNIFSGPTSAPLVATFVLNLRGGSSAPSDPSAGFLLGSVTPASNTTAPITIPSNNTTTAFNYVWVELVATFENPAPAGAGTQTSYSFSTAIGQVTFFNPTGVATGSSFTVEILGPPILYNEVITNWRLGAYGGPNGYPTCGAYHEGRIWLGGAIPNRFDASVSNGVNGSTINFAPTDQYGVVAANAAISYTLNSNGVNPIRAMKPDLQGVVLFTQVGEWLVQAPTTGPISAANIAARLMTKHGCANIEPVRVPHANLFVKRYSRHLLEYFADAFSGKYSAPNLADKAMHITSKGISELAFTSATTPIMWGYDTSGSLFGITYRRNSLMTSQEPDFYAWHRHTLGSGRIVQSICTGPSVGGTLDALTMVTNDASNIWHVEILTDPQDELTTLSQSWFLDDAVNPTSISVGSSSVTINGLWHLNGKTVQVFANGLDLGDQGDLSTTYADFTVTNGSITVTYGDGISAGPGRGLFTQAFASALSLSQIVVGFTYNSDGQVVRPIGAAETGARNGPAFGKIIKAYRYAMKLVNSIGLSVGTDFSKLKPANYKQADGRTAWPSNTVFSGLHYETLDDTPSHSRSVCWRISRPFPTTIVATGVNQEASDQ